MHGFPHAVKDLADVEGIADDATGFFGPRSTSRPRAPTRSSSSASARPARSSSARPTRPSSGSARRPTTTSSVRRSTPTTRPRRPAAAAAAPPSRSPCGWCRSPTAATSSGRCATRRAGTTCTASATVVRTCAAGDSEAFVAPGRRRRSDRADRARPRAAAAHHVGLRRAGTAVDRAGPGAADRRRPAPCCAAARSPGSATSAATCRWSPRCCRCVVRRWPASPASAWSVTTSGRPAHDQRLRRAHGPVADLADLPALARRRVGLKALYDDPTLSAPR